MNLDLETLRHVKQFFEFHSDHSTRCNGYTSLCDLITTEENKSKLIISQTHMEHVRKSNVLPKRKCPLCHTLNAENIGRCLCGNYIEAINENTWKEEKWMEMHMKWEDGELGYNIIYERLKKLGYE